MPCCTRPSTACCIPSRAVNDAVGAVLALFFPAPFHLIRQGHIGHHIRNRSDDEAFDLYFDGESRFWKCVLLYGTLTGLFWALIYVTNLIVILVPSLAVPDPGGPHVGRLFRVAEPALSADHLGRGGRGRGAARRAGVVVADPARALFRGDVRVRLPVVGDAVRAPLRHRAGRAERGAQSPHVPPARSRLAEPQLASQSPRAADGAVALPAVARRTGRGARQPAGGVWKDVARPAAGHGTRRESFRGEGSSNESPAVARPVRAASGLVVLFRRRWRSCVRGR